MDLFSQYSAAAYCHVVTTGTVGTAIACSTSNCPLVEASGATLLGSFNNVGLYSSSGYLAVDTANKRLILASRGAELTGLLILASLYLTPCPTICAACNCFDGIYDSWVTEARPIVTPLLAKYLPMYPGYKLVVTGHSLGASQAIYAAAEIRNNGTNATVYNFGQPRLGDLAFSEYVTSQANNSANQNYRVTHTDDPDPRIGDTSQGFMHISPEYWISYDANTTTYDVSAAQIKVIVGYNNLTGCSGQSGLDLSAHGKYFQSNIAACAVPLGL
ncbi:alpha/beta-hydrolase [Athelia psychrophila]|uniref:Alpha/beta-hydrolase n=1 Tax=Athelia psychrophila TaxID=1759441 RepID=A0A167XLD3_9AGAM|nr:alpha/beta-hydrolase [Fibularhizoctonia sp. CBS 109695]